MSQTGNYTLSIEEWRGLRKKKPKYRNQKCQYDGKQFDSFKERDRYKVLQILERSGHISDLKTQISFALGSKITYMADFTYMEKGELIVEDVKGFKTQVYRLKKKLMFNIHKIKIRET